MITLTFGQSALEKERKKGKEGKEGKLSYTQRLRLVSI